MQPQNGMVRDLFVQKRLYGVSEILECEGGRSLGLLCPRNDMVNRFVISGCYLMDDEEDVVLDPYNGLDCSMS